MKDRYSKYMKIAERAENDGIYNKGRNNLIMIIERADKIFSFRLDDWLNANKLDFACDLIGIVDNNLKSDFGGFIPKFATWEV